MSAAAAASRRRERLNQRITRQRTRSVSVARLAGVIGRAGRNAECGDGSGSVGKHAPQSLGHGDHPLPHGHRRDDVIDKTLEELGEGGEPPE